ncbi:MAG: hypothetical protein WC645_02655 [Candidatus Margulisiibacteriota bacterium]
MGLKVCDLPSIRWRKVRVFELKSRADLERIGRIHLRDNYEPATIGRRIGVPSQDLKSMGISHEGINIRQLGRTLDTGMVAPNLNLRAGETKDPDLLLRVIACRLGNEDETLSFDLFDALDKLPNDELKIRLVARSLKLAIEESDLKSGIELLYVYAVSLSLDDPAKQRDFVMGVLDNCERPEIRTGVDIAVNISGLIYPQNIPEQIKMIGEVGQKLYGRSVRYNHNCGLFTGLAIQALFPRDAAARAEVALKNVHYPSKGNSAYNLIDYFQGLLEGLGLEEIARDNFIASFIKSHYAPASFSPTKARLILHLSSGFYPNDEKERIRFIAGIIVRLYPDDSKPFHWKRAIYAMIDNTYNRERHFSYHPREELLDELLIQCSRALHPKRTAFPY